VSPGKGYPDTNCTGGCVSSRVGFTVVTNTNSTLPGNEPVVQPVNGKGKVVPVFF